RAGVSRSSEPQGQSPMNATPSSQHNDRPLDEKSKLPPPAAGPAEPVPLPPAPEPSAAGTREQRLQEAILSYLKAADASQPPDPQEFLARYPDLAPELEAFFADQKRRHPLVELLRALALVNPPVSGAAAVLPHLSGDASACPVAVSIPGYEILGVL